MKTDEPIELFGAKITCLNIHEGYSPRPNEEKVGEFHYVKISEGKPVEILKEKDGVPENYTRRKVEGIVKHDDGNLTVHAKGASYFVNIHDGPELPTRSSLKPI